MTNLEFSRLRPGQIVRSASGQTWIISANYGQHVTAVQTVDISNPTEWEIVTKVTLVNGLTL